MNPHLTSLLLATLPLGALADAPQAATAPCPPAAPQGIHTLRPPSREQVAMRIMVRQLLLARYDDNGNGKLDREERSRQAEDAHKARRQQALAFIRRFDTDGDGKLTPEERAAMQQAVEERRQAEEADSDAPPPPRHAGRRGRPEGRHHGPRPPRPPMGEHPRMMAFTVQQLVMDAYDADEDGKLDTAESARLREDGEKLYAAREAELLALYDTDKDGKLSEDELQAALQQLRPRPQRNEHGTPPPPHQGKRAMHHPIHRLLDTHFDIDILLNLAHPQAEDSPTPPSCAHSAPSTN